MISTDRKIFDEGSAVRTRMIEYGANFGELHIIVFSLKKDGLQDVQRVSKSVFAYPTNSANKISRIFGAIKIGEAILKHEYEEKGESAVITCQDPFETGFVGRRLSNALRVPLQLQVHTDFLSPYFGKESIRNRFRVFLALFLLPRANGVRVVSERIKQSLLDHLPNFSSRVDVVPIFVDTNRLQQATYKNDLRKKYSRFKKIVLMASRFSPEKNIKLALHAFVNVVIKHKDAGLIIIGDGPEKKLLEKEAEYLRVRSHVVFEGWQRDLASYYKCADLFVLTSNYEGYGMSLVEAVALGTPTISTEVGISDKLLSADACVPVGDVEALSGKISLMLDSADRRSAIVRYSQGRLQYVISKNKEDNIMALRNSLERLIRKSS